MVSRRTVIKSAAAVGAFLVGQSVVRTSDWSPASANAADLTESGELYSGFLLLPWGVAAPAPARSSPVRVPQTEGATRSVAVYETLDNNRLARRITFPFYSFPQSALQTAFLEEAIVFTNLGGEVVTVTRVARVYDPQLNHTVDAIRLIANRNVPSPVPVWPGGRPEVGLITQQKVKWTPVPGLSSQSGNSEHVSWVERDVLYGLEYKSRLFGSSAQQFVSSLQLI